MTIMIVDDSAMMRSTIRRSLSHTEASFCECGDGTEALATYTRERPDWVLMDIRMKRMNGFEATREILSSFPEAKIIIVTQYDEAKLQMEAKQAGAVEVVLKENLIDIERIIQTYRN